MQLPNSGAVWWLGLRGLVGVTALSLGLLQPVMAQPVMADSTDADKAPGATSLYQALGGPDGIHALTDDFVRRLTSDARIAAQFRETNLKRLREKLEEQFCQVSGGGCHYTGDPMREVHQGLRVSEADFNALVEDLQRAMDAQGIPFARQNAFLALLAPMHRDIIAAPQKP